MVFEMIILCGGMLTLSSWANVQVVLWEICGLVR